MPGRRPGYTIVPMLTLLAAAILPLVAAIYLMQLAAVLFKERRHPKPGEIFYLLGSVGVLWITLQVVEWWNRTEAEAAERARQEEMDKETVQRWKDGMRAKLASAPPKSVADAVSVFGRAADECQKYKFWQPFTMRWSLHAGSEWQSIAYDVESCEPTAKILRDH